MDEIIIDGIVVHGAKRGRIFGFPTANIELGESFSELVNGVYAAEVIYAETKYIGVANIGTHPTVGELANRLLEVFIFDFDKDIYGERLKVTLIEFIRKERRFDSIDELKSQINSDTLRVKEIFD